MNTKLIIFKAMVVAVFVLASLESAAQSKDFDNTVILKNGTEINDVKVEENYIVTSSDGKST
ncbi:MAG: hypothetical protein IPQ05_18910, partial [Leptospiraceae bacterium]|nr:hypothetical protein [Leptospiraceae bacterium]